MQTTQQASRGARGRLGATLLVALVCGFAGSASAQDGAADADAIEARVVGVTVGDPLLPADAFDYQPIEPGTTVKLLLSSDTARFIDVDDDASELAVLEDDQGRDLTQAVRDDGFTRSGIGPFPMISGDGSMMVVEVSGPRAPRSDAAGVVLRAKVAVRTATGERVVTLEDQALAAGELAVDGYDVSLTDVETGDGFSGPELTLTFELSGDASEELAAVRLLDAEGEAIESNGSMSFGFDRNRTLALTYPLGEGVEAAPESATLELVFWEGLDTVMVPVDLAVTLGVAE